MDEGKTYEEAKEEAIEAPGEGIGNAGDAQVETPDGDPQTETAEK